MADETHEERIAKLEVQMKAFADAQVGQGILEWRIERNIEMLTGDVQDLVKVVRTLADHQAATQASLSGLIGQIDRFIRGRGGNGAEQTQA